MSSKVASPTANILRNSRLFSMPPPLAGDANELRSYNRWLKISESATRPYPVQQTVTTPRSSLSRGDWGFKRPLPLRSTTHTSTPYLRVNAVDTREHITDYESGADLTLTLNKFQNLNLPITMDVEKSDRQASSKGKSVFEDHLDNTDQEWIAADPDMSRWKFKGPWVAGMKPGDFDAFVKRKVKGRSAEFFEFVRKHRVKELERERNMFARKASQQGQEIDDKPVVVSDEDVASYIRGLRNNFILTSVLSRLVRDFLDLPPLPDAAPTSHVARVTMSEPGPPTTHPSAGLSYLRSNAFLQNHPVLGPQRFHPPIEARVISGGEQRSFQGGNALAGKLGVAGVVTEGTSTHGRKRVTVGPIDPDDRQARRDESAKTIGIGTPGGNRIWVEPVRAGIDSRGRIALTAANADVTAIGVVTGELTAPSLYPTSGTPDRRNVARESSGGVSMSPFGRAPSRGYGLDSSSKYQDGTARMVEHLERDMKN